MIVGAVGAFVFGDAFAAAIVIVVIVVSVVGVVVVAVVAIIIVGSNCSGALAIMIRLYHGNCFDGLQVFAK